MSKFGLQQNDLDFGTKLSFKGGLPKGQIWGKFLITDLTRDVTSV